MQKKVMITIDDNILNKIDIEAKKSGLNRSAFITSAMNEYIYQRQNANDILTKILDSDEIRQAITEKIKSNEN